MYLFGFDGASLETLRAHVQEACEHPKSPRVLSGVTVSGAGLVLATNADGKVGSGPPNLLSYLQMGELLDAAYRTADSAPGDAEPDKNH